MTDASEPGRRLSVAFLLHSFPEWSETFLLRQVVGLLELGHDVRLLCREPGDTTVLHDAVRRHALLDRVVHVDGPRGAEATGAPLAAVAAAARSPGLALRALRGGTRLDGSTLRFASALARAGPVDVVHAHYGDVALQLAGVAPLLGAPLVASFYGYDCSSYPRRHGRDLFAPLFARAAAITGLSAPMLDRLRELGCPPAKLRLQRIGVDVRRFEPPLSRAGSPPRVLTVARLVEKKGVDTLLHALASLRAEVPELCCEVIGDGPLRGRLEALAVELGLGGRVVFRGACPEQEVVAAMQAAHCFVLASRQAEDGDEEGTPTVLMEASSAALPVIGTRHAGVAEIVKDGETGLLVPPADPGALATALRRLLADAALRQAMGERGRAHVAAVFDQPLLSRRLQELYEEVDREATPARRSS